MVDGASLLDAATQPPASLCEGGGPVRAVAFSGHGGEGGGGGESGKGGGMLAVAFHRGEVLLLDAATLSVQGRVALSPAPQIALAFSPDGKSLLCSNAGVTPEPHSRNPKP